MKPAGPAFAVLLTVAMLNGPSHAQDGQSVPDGPYLGQEPPGATAAAFAPGLISTENFEYGGVFSPDMDEFYYIRERAEDGDQEFVVFRLENGRWRETVISPRIGQPYIAPDGRTIHLGRRFMTRTEDGLSEVQELGPPFEDFRIMRLTAATSGTYYFDEIGSESGDGIIRSSRLIDGEYQAPVPLGPQINTGTFNAHPFIAPDESFILWDGQRDTGFGDSDIYVSFRQPDGTWGEAINLGEMVNTDAWEASASVTPDGRHIFFHRLTGAENEDGLSNVDIYWVDVQVLETLRDN